MAEARNDAYSMAFIRRMKRCLLNGVHAANECQMN